MAVAKRMMLFIITNLAIMITISVIFSVLGLNTRFAGTNLDLVSLMIFCGVWGMGGAFMSLAVSKWMAKMAYSVKIIDPNTTDPRARDLVMTVHRLAQGAGLQKMPEVGVYESPELNAFATGPTRNSALVAVSSGLLHGMDRKEVEGVLGHEVAHVANGDMVTMTLIQGVVNAFVMFFARIAAWAVASALRGNSSEDRGPSTGVYHLTVIVFDIVLGILASMIVMWFSRQREFRADQGSARLAGRDKMIAALQALDQRSRVFDPRGASLAAFKISGAPKGGLQALFRTHPTIEERIQRLREYQMT